MIERITKKLFIILGHISATQLQTHWKNLRDGVNSQIRNGKQPPVQLRWLAPFLKGKSVFSSIDETNTEGSVEPAVNSCNNNELESNNVVERIASSCNQQIIVPESQQSHPLVAFDSINDSGELEWEIELEEKIEDSQTIKVIFYFCYLNGQSAL